MIANVDLYTIIFAIFLIITVSFALFLYSLSRKKYRAILPIGFLVILILFVTKIVQTFDVVFASGAVCLALFDAIDYSKISVTGCMMKADRYLRSLLLPLSFIERSIRKSVRTSNRLILAGSYLAFELVALLLIPLLLAQTLRGFLSLSWILLIFVGIWALSREECERGFRRISGEP